MGDVPSSIRSFFLSRRKEQRFLRLISHHPSHSQDQEEQEGHPPTRFSRSEPGGLSPSHRSHRAAAGQLFIVRMLAWCIPGAGLSHPCERLLVLPTQPKGMVGRSTPPPSHLPLFTVGHTSVRHGITPFCRFRQNSAHQAALLPGFDQQ